MDQHRQEVTRKMSLIAISIGRRAFDPPQGMGVIRSNPDKCPSDKPAAKKVSLNAKRIENRAKNKAAVLDAVKKSGGWVTVKYIAKECDLSVGTARILLNEHVDNDALQVRALGSGSKSFEYAAIGVEGDAK